MSILILFVMAIVAFILAIVANRKRFDTLSGCMLFISIMIAGALVDEILRVLL